MSQRNNEQFIAILKKEVVPALGCTEPAAVALASAKARVALGAEPESVEVRASGNVIKNGMGVGIPGTGAIGLPVAAALGAIAGNPDRGLEALDGVSLAAVKEALAMIDAGKITITVADTEEKLYVEAICRAGGDSGRVVISGSHTNIILIERNGAVIFEKAAMAGKGGEEDHAGDFLTVSSIYDFSVNANLDDLRFILDGAKLNRAIAEEGLRVPYGLGVGKKMLDYIEKGYYPAGLVSGVVAFTSAAVDARMSGVELPVMSNTGSGNQGLTLSLPVIKIAERLGKSEEQLIRALTLANLISIHIKRKLGILSALCGVVSASTAASCGITFLLGGGKKQIGCAIKNMIANISGMICDGAKPGCALKVSTGSAAAVESALLAVDNVEVSPHDGIVEKSIEKTIDNLCELGARGMVETDRVILGIMTCK